MKRSNEIIAFFHACQDHNWFYSYSDILDVAIAGEFAQANLRDRCRGDELLTRIYKAWQDYYFSGPPMVPEMKPKIDQFI